MPGDGSGLTMEPSPWEEKHYVDLIIIMVYLQWKPHPDEGKSWQDQPEWSKKFKYLRAFFDFWHEKRFTEEQIMEAWVEINKDFYRTDRGSDTWLDEAVDPFRDDEQPLLQQYTRPFKRDGNLELEKKIRSTQEAYHVFWYKKGPDVKLDDKDEELQQELRGKMRTKVRDLEGYDPLKRLGYFPEWADPPDFQLFVPASETL
ncbi:MAG: hypothetical protein Q9183_004132 [Haloplaca sp. 2 TL-2023]